MQEVDNAHPHHTALLDAVVELRCAAATEVAERYSAGNESSEQDVALLATAANDQAPWQEVREGGDSDASLAQHRCGLSGCGSSVAALGAPVAFALRLVAGQLATRPFPEDPRCFPLILLRGLSAGCLICCRFFAARPLARRISGKSQEFRIFPNRVVLGPKLALGFGLTRVDCCHPAPLWRRAVEQRQLSGPKLQFLGKSGSSCFLFSRSCRKPRNKTTTKRMPFPKTTFLFRPLLSQGFLFLLPFLVARPPGRISDKARKLPISPKAQFWARNM